MKNMDGINYVARRCWIVGMKNDGIEFCVKSGMCWFIENGYWVLDWDVLVYREWVLGIRRKDILRRVQQKNLYSS
jgi:hypothetical protein